MTQLTERATITSEQLDSVQHAMDTLAYRRHRIKNIITTCMVALNQDRSAGTEGVVNAPRNLSLRIPLALGMRGYLHAQGILNETGLSIQRYSYLGIAIFLAKTYFKPKKYDYYEVDRELVASLDATLDQFVTALCQYSEGVRKEINFWLAQPK